MVGRSRCSESPESRLGVVNSRPLPSSTGDTGACSDQDQDLSPPGKGSPQAPKTSQRKELWISPGSFGAKKRSSRGEKGPFLLLLLLPPLLPLPPVGSNLTMATGDDPLTGPWRWQLEEETGPPGLDGGLHGGGREWGWGRLYRGVGRRVGK